MIKKYFLALSLALFLLIPASASAQDIAALEAQIEALLKQVQSLQTQLDSLQPGASTSSCTTQTFTRNLYLNLDDGATGGEVSQLQSYLQGLGYFTYPEITGYFGPVTEQAVQAFQRAKGVVSSGSPETTGYGVWGPKTRATVESACNNLPAIDPDPKVGPASLKFVPDGQTVENGEVFRTDLQISEVTIRGSVSVSLDCDPGVSIDLLKVYGDTCGGVVEWNLFPEVSSGGTFTTHIYNSGSEGADLWIRARVLDESGVEVARSNTQVHVLPDEDQGVDDVPKITSFTGTDLEGDKEIYRVDWSTDSPAEVEIVAVCDKPYSSVTITTLEDKQSYTCEDFSMLYPGLQDHNTFDLKVSGNTTQIELSFEMRVKKDGVLTDSKLINLMFAPALSNTPTSDSTPRISYWWGKVNQHVEKTDSGYAWVTDPDGVSGADLDMLTYCKKFYPDTNLVLEYSSGETINTWRAAGNTGEYYSVKPSYWCAKLEAESTSVLGATKDQSLAQLAASLEEVKKLLDEIASGIASSAY